MRVCLVLEWLLESEGALQTTGGEEPEILARRAPLLLDRWGPVGVSW